MTDAAKAAVWTAVWTPWGTPQSLTGTATLDARFPGQWYQMEAGLAYNWNRHYDPTLGRYTQPDPLGFVDGPSVYGYAIANPQRFVDFEGRYAAAAGGGASAVYAFCVSGPAQATICLCALAATATTVYMSSSGGSGDKNKKYQTPVNPNKKDSDRSKGGGRERNKGIDEEHSVKPKGGPRGGRIGN